MTENPLTRESIANKIKAHGNRLQELEKRANNLRTQLNEAVQEGQRVIGAIQQLGELDKELAAQQAQPTDDTKETSTE